MNLRDGLDSMFRHMERLQSPRAGVTTHTVKWRGRVFPCTISTERRGEVLQIGGIVVNVQLTIIIRTSAMEPMLDTSATDTTVDDVEITSDNDTQAPRPNFDIHLESRSRLYRIGRVSLDASESHYTLDVGDPYTP